MDRTLKCIVVDDEPLALALLSDYATKVPGLDLVLATSDPIRALELAKGGQIDLVFLDMQMPELNGIQFLKILQRRCLVIITTAYAEYALDGYEHQVVDYLLKPITLDRFMLALEKVFERMPAVQPGYSVTLPTPPVAETPYIFDKTDYRMVKLMLADIYYLEGARDYVIIHTTGGQVLTLQSLKSLEETLPAKQFIRIHKSYIIALSKINFVERNRVAINDQLIPVSDTYRKNLNREIGLES